MTDATAQTPKIRLTNVHKRFGTKHVLQGFTLDVMTRESVVIIGGSGTGKSVMLKCILGLLTPDEGEIEIDGQPTVHLSSSDREAVNAKIGMLFQNAALFDSLSVWENVAFGLIQGKRMKRKAAKEIAIEKLAQVGLGADVGALSPAELSGGMRKRVGLARAIAGNPDIIFFDEPTTGLDPIMGHVIDDLIVKCVKEVGATAISITHDMPSARRIADRMAMLYKGAVIWNGPVAEIDHSGNAYVDQFINGSADGPIQMELRKL
ncbi:MAG: ATP-binding cassette domain-containing protein [Alphaproteobacteria bacterium]|nr:ATP-binding cassette domain-containing protein [Alphaproteobacteria bacterium]MBO6864132.1 ATP-binding cassette domain-containing protein [Alphaproteobacteria bacterium]